MSPNASAFLSVIAACEGAGYTTLYGGKPFQSFDDHPRRSITAGGYTSTAAGRYQILSRTWDDFCVARGPRRFDEQGQDDCALWLIDRRGATADVEAGRLDQAIVKCGKEWASLPGSPYGQPTRSLQFCLDHYLGAGGTLSTQAPPAPEVAPTKEAPMGASLLLSLLPQVLQLFAPRVQQQLGKVTGQPPDVLNAFAASLFDKLQQATGKPDPVQAVAAVTDNAADPATKRAVIESVQEHALDYLDKTAPLLDKAMTLEKAQWDAELAGKDAASKRALQEKWDMTPWLVWFAGGTATALVLALTAALIYQAVFKDDINTALVGLAGPLLAISMGVWREVFAYRFDGNKDSATKDAALAQIAAANAK